MAPLQTRSEEIGDGYPHLRTSASSAGRSLRFLPSSLQRRVLLGIRLAVQGRGDELLAGELLAGEVADDRVDGHPGDLVGELDRVGVDLAFLDPLLAFGLTVEADDLHLV